MSNCTTHKWNDVGLCPVCAGRGLDPRAHMRGNPEYWQSADLMDELARMRDIINWMVGRLTWGDREELQEFLESEKARYSLTESGAPAAERKRR